MQIISMPQSNAFTLPGGKIFITDTLIREADSTEEILRVLAHEAGHYQKRHILQGVIRGSFLTLSLNFLTGDFSQFVLIDPNTLSRIVGLQFDRGLEKEADTYAVETLKGLGIGSNGVIHFFEKMKKKYRYRSSCPRIYVDPPSG
ncbi:MAG: M48 family metallopeptidase [Bdellovibrio sp.]|nr:M48 family metallopeptidase [Bdellovibrio sp.]